MPTNGISSVRFTKKQKQIIEEMIRTHSDRLGCMAKGMDGYRGNNVGTILRGEFQNATNGLDLSQAIREAKQRLIQRG